MIELWLNFKDEYGDSKRVLVEREMFVIGRTPENDLAVPFNNISRQHAKIENVDNTFLISDCGSSNGSTINDQNLLEATPLKNGDRLNLGGWLEIEIEIISDDENANNGSGQSGENSFGSGADDSAEEPPLSSSAAAGGASAASSSTSSAKAPASSSSSSFGWLLLAPVLVIFVLLIGGIILLVSGNIGAGKSNNRTEKEVAVSSPTDDEEKDTPTPEKTKTPVPVDSSTPITAPTSSSSPDGSPTQQGTTPAPTTPSTSGSTETTSTPKVQDDREKVTKSSALLLRRIARNDSTAFLTTQQATFVTDKIKPLKNSSGLAENIKDAKKNSSKIVELAKTKNLTPLFLLVATLTELGTTKGDVIGKATEILESLGELSRKFGGELVDDNLLVIAATKQSKDDELLNTISKSSTEFPNSPARSVWFLHDKNKLSEAQFDKVLRFLAIGTITQNPKDFNVNADAVSF